MQSPWCNGQALSNGLTDNYASATNQCRKKLEACINAEDGHSEHLLWHCLPDSSFATHHNRFFLEPPMTTYGQVAQSSNVWKNATNLQSDEKVLQFTS